jgi:hypothetical protein
MNIEIIKKMVQDGFAIKRIAKILNLDIKNIKEIINLNRWAILKEDFSENKIDKICDLYQQGVSAKSLGIKYSIDKRRVQKWVENKNLLRDKSESHRFTEFNKNIFDIINSSEKAYWLGFFYADAYNCNKTNTVSVSLQTRDLKHLQKLANFMGLSPNKITYTKNKEGHEYFTLKMYSKHLCKTLNDKGCPQAKSFIIEYPEWLDEKLYVHFIRGLFDGDGSICKRETNEWKWSIATTKECGESIQQIILDKLKIIVNLRNISKTNNNTYELESNGNEKVLKLADWLYKDSPEIIRLDRKYEKYLSLIEQQNNRSFKKNEYKVSEENKKEIIDAISNGSSVNELSNKYNLHQRTITKIKHDDIYLYDKIVSINGQPITAKYVKTLDYESRENLIEPLFQYFRSQGWLYPDNISKIHNSWKKLCNFKPNLSSNELFNNSSLATDICKYFCHKFYEATEKNELNMIQLFNDDDKLKKLIKNRLGFDWWDKENNDETFNISFRMLIQGMRSSRLVPSISMFKPDIAKYMYMKYSDENDIVYDYSAGWGGRMLGAASCNREYIGTDPWTTDELKIMSESLGLKKIKLIKAGSETVNLEENSIDFSFSSPPYFDQEYYSNDLTQAYNNGENYFYDIYWSKTLDNVKKALKPNKWFGLNVKNYPKMLEMAIDRFGEIKEEVKLKTIRSHLNKSAGTEKYELIYMFRNLK